MTASTALSVPTVDPLYPIESALGRALDQANTDRNGHEQRRLQAAIDGLSVVKSVSSDCAALSETDERFARQMLLDIVDHNVKPLTALALAPFVQFVRSCC